MKLFIDNLTPTFSFKVLFKCKPKTEQQALYATYLYCKTRETVVNECMTSKGVQQNSV